MRVLILGAAGMLGHKLCQMLSARFDTFATLRGLPRDLARYGLIEPARLLGGVDAADFDSIVRAVAQVGPAAVINCIGIIKQLPTAKDPIVSIAANSLLPHRLGNLCRAVGARLVHISTDCVFSGRKGMYCEDDPADAEDLYGRSKLLGEVAGPGCLTLRTSIIGRELCTQSGLVEWFLGNRGGRVRGFTRAIYTGLTTRALAEVISTVLERHPQLEGLWQVSSEPIDKCALLRLINEAYGAEVEIVADDQFACDRSLDSTRFRRAIGWQPPAWPAMIADLRSDPTPYDEWRTQ